MAAIERGIPQRWIAEAAYRTERAIAEGARPKVGVNIHADDLSDRPAAVERFDVDPGVVERQIERTRGRVRSRDPGQHARAMANVARVAREGGNVMPGLIDAARAGATLGETSDVFRGIFGEFREPDPW